MAPPMLCDVDKFVDFVSAQEIALLKQNEHNVLYC
jgi:hypothetical protein